MTSMRIRRFNESVDDKTEIGMDFESAKKWLIENFDEDRVVAMLDEEILEWVDREMMDNEGYESEYDWYIDYGRGEAESAVVKQIVDEVSSAGGGLSFDPSDESTDLYTFLRQTHLCLDY